MFVIGISICDDAISTHVPVDPSNNVNVAAICKISPGLVLRSQTKWETYACRIILIEALVINLKLHPQLIQPIPNPVR